MHVSGMYSASTDRAAQATILPGENHVRTQLRQIDKSSMSIIHTNLLDDSQMAYCVRMHEKINDKIIIGTDRCFHTIAR